MIERPPRLASRRFGEILWPALRFRPLAALAGLYWFVTRRRVRGWSRLVIAASSAPEDYQRWIAGGEKRAFANYRRRYPIASEPMNILAVVVGAERYPEPAASSVASIRHAFGGHILAFANGVDGPAAESLSLESGGDSLEWLLFVLAGDRVSPELPDALRRVSELGSSDLVFWDEDVLQDAKRGDPWVKPDWDPTLFGALGSGLAGASLVSRAALSGLAGIGEIVDRQSLEGVLTKVAAGPNVPAHVPLILTHRASMNALPEPDTARLGRHTTGKWPSVSIIVPTRDRRDLLVACWRGLQRTEYPGAVEWIFVDNGTRDGEALRLLAEIATHPHAQVVRDDAPFNFSRLNNDGAARAGGDFLCFFNNDVEPIDRDWLTTLVSHASGDDVGAVGACLLYPSGRIQHAGVAIGVGGAAGHVQKGVMPAERHHWTWHRSTREVSAVTAAVMVVEKRKFLKVGGFDADAFPVAFNDVDLCLRLKQAGLRNLYVAEACLIHRESESRGDDRARKNAPRYARELAALQERWGTRDAVDPHFSPLFSRLIERCVLVP